MPVRSRHLSRSVVSHTWSDRHSWVATLPRPLTISREQAEVAPRLAAEEVASRAHELGAAGNYRHYYGWRHVQLVLSAEFQRTPDGPREQETELIGPVLDRRGLGFHAFMQQSMEKILRFGPSLYLVIVKQIAIHHYRRRR